MLESARYSERETLGNGRQIVIRALRPDDEDSLLAVVGQASVQSLYRRFFGVRRRFSKREVAFFVNVDFVKHVALAAVTEEAGRTALVGTGRYIVTKPGSAEVAFAVADEFQDQGIGTMLMRHLATIARDAGLSELTAEVLTENENMLKVFEKSGLRVNTKQAAEVTHVTMHLR